VQIVALRALNIDSLFLRVWAVDGEMGGMLSRVDAVGEMVELQGSRNYNMSSKIPELLANITVVRNWFFHPDDNIRVAQNPFVDPSIQSWLLPPISFQTASNHAEVINTSLDLVFSRYV
jgi:hypothetical protein